jgi:DNA-binding transcriptional ArsR family regulator
MKCKNLQKNIKVGCDPSINEWVNAISSALSKCAEKVPAGWKTADEVRELMGLSQSNASKKIRLLERAGLVEKKRFYIKSSRGLYPEIHYKLIKSK